MANIFPLIPGLQEQIDSANGEPTKDIQELGKCFKFDFNTNSFVLENGKLVELDKIDAVKQWIKLILNTYKDKFNVYTDSNFYCNVKDVSGKRLTPDMQSKIISDITSSLLTHRYIKSVGNFSFSQERMNVNINFDVTLASDEEISVSETI
jgi:hypothetical protein